jgi:NTP pyrophosphatase (non-canonical NTP hydrolase)
MTNEQLSALKELHRDRLSGYVTDKAYAKSCEKLLPVLLDELEEYHKNPIAQMVACWKYVTENTREMQLNHIVREVNEAVEETDLDKQLLEIFDVLQACITMMYILKIKYHVDIAELIQQGIYKNTHRPDGSYYE